MKIRTGYVSNSSSSSFCILGLVIPEDYNQDTFYDIEDKLFIQLRGGIYNYYDQVIIGASPTEMLNDETLNQFKKRICNQLKKVNINANIDDLSWFIDGGYDG